MLLEIVLQGAVEYRLAHLDLKELAGASSIYIEVLLSIPGHMPGKTPVYPH